MTKKLKFLENLNYIKKEKELNSSKMKVELGLYITSFNSSYKKYLGTLTKKEFTSNSLKQIQDAYTMALSIYFKLIEMSTICFSNTSA